MEAPVKKTVSN